MGRGEPCEAACVMLGEPFATIRFRLDSGRLAYGIGGLLRGLWPFSDGDACLSDTRGEACCILGDTTERIPCVYHDVSGDVTACANSDEVVERPGHCGERTAPAYCGEAGDLDIANEPNVSNSCVAPTWCLTYCKEL